MLSHQSLLANAKAKLLAAPQYHSDVRLTVLSIAHAYARTCDVGTWLVSGSTLAMASGFKGWSLRSDLIQPTLCNAVPSLAQRMFKTESASHLRMLGCGGAAMSGADFDRWRSRGIPVIQGYGATETGPVISSQGPGDSIAGHVGKVVEGWEWERREERLFVRGPSLMTRYWDDDTSSAHLDDEGWFDTKDLVTISDGSGQLKVLGRADDRIVLSNGHNVDPILVENSVLGFRGISFAFVDACEDGRGVDLWIDGKVELERLSERFKTLPQWSQPKNIYTIGMSDSQRTSMLTRKGSLRRKAIRDFLRAEENGSVR